LNLSPGRKQPKMRDGWGYNRDCETGVTAVTGVVVEPNFE
jgi:hypothetical protein